MTTKKPYTEYFIMKPDDQTQTILPCPFCGSHGIGIKISGNDYRLQCTNCHAGTKLFRLDLTVSWKEEALPYWNARSRQLALLEGLKNARMTLYKIERITTGQYEHDLEAEEISDINLIQKDAREALSAITLLLKEKEDTYGE